MKKPDPAGIDPPEGPPRRARAAGRWRRLAVIILGGATSLALFTWFVVIPYPWTLRSRNPARTSLMDQRAAEARAAETPFEIEQDWVPLDAISSRLVRAVLVAEDYRFRDHHGIDWVSLAEEVHWSGDDTFSWWSSADRHALSEALRYVWAHRTEIRGRSTITQQLAKNLYFGTDRSLIRKAMEFVVAGRLEKRLGKDRILEIYLNVVEWGPGVFGVEAAAQTYFGRPAASLTLDQAAALAGTLPHPLTSNPARNPSRMLWRKNLILARLDPAAGIPAAPLPLPDPDLGAADSLSFDTLQQAMDPAPFDTTSGAIDSVSPDTIPGATDSMSLDTLSRQRRDSVPRDTVQTST